MSKQEDDAVGQYFWGQLGSRTGHWANELGYQAHRQRQEFEAAERQRQNDAIAARQGAGSGYTPSAAAGFVEDCIPLALSRSLGLLAAIAVLSFGYREGYLPPVRAGGVIVWESVAVAAVAALLGYAVGANVLNLAIRLADICLRIVFGLLKIALVLGGVVLLFRFLTA